jgi:hypothetical protein
LLSVRYSLSALTARTESGRKRLEAEFGIATWRSKLSINPSLKHVKNGLRQDIVQFFYYTRSPCKRSMDGLSWDISAELNNLYC